MPVTASPSAANPSVRIVMLAQVRLRPPGRLKRRVSKKLGVAIDSKTNDGIVPTLSQIHGRIGGIVLADHMDVVGLFTRTDQTDRGWQPPWLKSGAGFTELRFQKLWRSIAAELTRPSHAVDPPTEVIR